jgi:LacI family transcriptional regulator
MRERRPPDRSVTQRDVARVAGVHRATVSRALDPRRRGLLDPSTVKRVTDAAEGLGYMPNALARGLKTNRSFVIGVAVPDVSSPSSAPLVGALESALRDAGYTALVASTRDEPETLTSVTQELAARRVDGIVLATAKSAGFALKALRVGETPIVVVGAAPPDDTCPSVSIDHRLGAQIALSHLIRLGHTRIGLIAERRSSSLGAAHHEAYEQTLAAAGLPLEPGLIEIAEPTRALAAAEACSALFYRGSSPTAILAMNDGAALGCYAALAEFGLKVPADVSIVGYGNMPYGRYVSPSLTTVSLPLSAVGKEAAAQVLRLLHAEAGSQVGRVQLQPHLVHRHSTAPPPLESG